ncbi:MAG: hypothetical protein Q7T73_18725 [Beijerinckiaceae bacterium]|nr:hypothetical protein [Beijerinckiaceae bacterium]
MNAEILNLCNALDGLAASVRAAFNESRTLTAVFGWNFLPLSKEDLASIASSLSSDLRAASAPKSDAELSSRLKLATLRVQELSGLVSNIFNGNGAQAAPVYVTTLQVIRQSLEPEFGFFIGIDSKIKPSSVNKRLQNVSEILDAVEPKLGSMTDQIANIQQAHGMIDEIQRVGESFKEQLLSLSAERELAGRLAKEVALEREQVARLIEEAKSTLLDSQSTSRSFSASCTEFFDSEKLRSNTAILHAQNDFDDAIRDMTAQNAGTQLELRMLKDDVLGIKKAAEEALGKATTAGLAGAFHDRAKSLRTGLICWVVGLVLALCGAVIIGVWRASVLTVTMTPETPLRFFVFHAALSFSVLGGFLWFSWLATKQIGNIFRVSEDYAFKASVAKAYEGYRKEAKDIDPNFARQLFRSALSRFDEAPLRHVERQVDGSPLMDLSGKKTEKLSKDVGTERSETTVDETNKVTA